MSVVFAVLALLALTALSIIWTYVRRAEAPPDRPVRFAGRGTYQIPVVGESRYQAALQAICRGPGGDGVERHCQATLVLEEANPHDDNAVRVEVERRVVGYLPKALARQYRARLKEIGHPRCVGVCGAVVRGGWDSDPGSRGSFDIWLDLPAK